jgi:hypothetical protein
VVGYPFAFLVTVFLLLFLAFGDSRWFVLIALALVLFSGLVNRSVGEPSPATAGMLAALPTWSWSALALGAWAVFAAWYLRVRQVRGIVLTQEGGSQVDATRPVPRTVALRVLLLAPSAPHKEPLLVLILLVVVLMAHALPTFVAPLMMTMFAHAYVASVRQSRLLWLRIPGARDAVRRAIEQALWRHLAMGGVFLVVAAAIAASPLVGHGAAEIALGVASSAGAAIYAAYVALASVRGLATYFWGFGSMALLQIGLMVFSGVFREVFSPHALTAFMVLTAVELAGAALLRALAVRRWRTVDWLRFKPRSPFVGVPRSL